MSPEPPFVSEIFRDKLMVLPELSRIFEVFVALLKTAFFEISVVIQNNSRRVVRAFSANYIANI